MREFNICPVSHISHASVECIPQCILTQIILWVKPFFLGFPPKCLCNIQMWRIWWQKEEEQSPSLPIRYSLADIFRFMYSRVIQDDKGCTTYFKRKLFEKVQDKFGIDILLSNLPVTLALPVNKPKVVEFIRFLREKANIFTRKLPAIRDIAFAANMGFISIIKLYFISETHIFKFLEFLHLKLIMFFQGLSLRSTPYTFISSAKAFKRFLNVLSLTCLPFSTSHCALAVPMRCRFAVIAARIEDLSSSIERIALRPRPDLVLKPDKPSVWYRFTQLLILTAHKPVIEPTSLEVRPVDLSKMALAVLPETVARTFSEATFKFFALFGCQSRSIDSSHRRAKIRII